MTRWATRLGASFLLSMAAGPVLAARLEITLTNIENDRGMIRAALCTAATFTTKHCPFTGSAVAREGSVVIALENIPPGRYAVQAYHDEDGDGRLRRGLFGIPLEAIGFSRDAPVRLGGPRFEDAAIDVVGPVTTARVRLRHVMP